MSSYMTVKEAAAVWKCSERNIQLLCKQGLIPGAHKISGIWVIPMDSIRPGTENETITSNVHPEKLYGRTITVKVSDHPDEPNDETTGCTIKEYTILDGITLVFQDIHEETIDYGNRPPQFPPDLIAIQHCLEGRFEGTYPNGQCIYMGPGSLSVNLPVWSPIANSFPLKHYRGFYIAILPRIADISIHRLETSLGPLHIDLDQFSTYLSEKNRLALYPVTENIKQLLSFIYLSGTNFREGQLKLQVLELLQLLSSEQLSLPKPEHYFPQDQVKIVKEIQKYLIAHLDEHIPLTELASQFHISLTGMKTCFKGVYGQSIGKYLREYRLQMGAELLITTNSRIIDIAGFLGYENAGKFSEAFAKYYRKSPRDYRKYFCPPGEISNRPE